MNKTKFMTRIFSAINNEETEVLEQLDKDIDIAKEDGSCDTDQYVITASDDKVVLHDKVNDEDTEIIEDEDGDCTFAAVDAEGNQVPEETLDLVEEKEFADNKGPWCIVIKYVYTGTTKKTWHVYPKDKADELVKSGKFMKTWYKIVGNTYNTKEEAQHAMVDLKASKKFSEMTDEELDEKIKCDSLTFSRIKKFSLESLKSFAKGGWRDGKLYIKMGDSDVALDLKNKVAIIIDENLSCPIDPKKSFIDNLTTVEKFMKENDLKVFSENNSKIYSSADDAELMKIAKKLANISTDYLEQIDESKWEKFDKAHANIQKGYQDIANGLLGWVSASDSQLKSFVLDRAEDIYRASGTEKSILVQYMEELINFVSSKGQRMFSDANSTSEFSSSKGTKNSIQSCLNIVNKAIKNKGKLSISELGYLSRVLNNLVTSKFSDEDSTQEEFSDTQYVVVEFRNEVPYVRKRGTKDECNEWKNKNSYIGDLKVMTNKRLLELKKSLGFSVNSFSDANPTPEQEGVIDFLKGFVEEHPGEAKYLVELGAKWGPDNLLEGLNHDAEGDKSFSGHLDRSNMTFITDNDEYRKGDTISRDGEQFELVRLVDNSNDEYTWSVKAYSNKFSKFSPNVAKMFADSYDDPNEVKRNLRKSVKDAIGSLGLQVPNAEFENGYATITMKIHHDKVDKVKKAISKLRSDIGVICKCSDPSKTDLTWYDLIFIQKLNDSKKFSKFSPAVAKMFSEDKQELFIVFILYWDKDLLKFKREYPKATSASEAESIIRDKYKDYKISKIAAVQTPKDAKSSYIASKIEEEFKKAKLDSEK